MRVGFNYALQSPRLKTVLLRVFLFFLQSTALLALLPLVAQGLHGGGAGFFTVMLSCLGAGAVWRRSSFRAGAHAGPRPVRVRWARWCMRPCRH
jgi:hypothetical protein